MLIHDLMFIGKKIFLVRNMLHSTNKHQCSWLTLTGFWTVHLFPRCSKTKNCCFILSVTYSSYRPMSSHAKFFRLEKLLTYKSTGKESSYIIPLTNYLIPKSIIPSIKQVEITVIYFTQSKHKKYVIKIPITYNVIWNYSMN